MADSAAILNAGILVVDDNPANVASMARLLGLATLLVK